MKIKINKELLEKIPSKNRKKELKFFEWFHKLYGFEMDHTVYDYYLFKLEEEENCVGILNTYGLEALKVNYPRFHDQFYTTDTKSNQQSVIPQSALPKKANESYKKKSNPYRIDSLEETMWWCE